MGVDLDSIRALPRIRALPVLSRIFRQFLRRPALRDEGPLRAPRGVHAAAVIPHLVPAALSLRLHRIPMREELMIATALAADVTAGLTKLGQKELPSKYLYDTVGSRLFDVITELPEYGLTRAEERILNRHAGDIVRRLPEDLAVAELGSGGGRKTRRILEALCRSEPSAFLPI